MPEYVVQRVSDALNSVKKPINGSKIHLFGIAYKRDVNDMRESPALDVLELLIRRGAVVTYSDPWVPQVHEGHLNLKSVDVDAAIAGGFDCAVITTDHAAFDYDRLAKLPLVVDTRNALKGTTGANVFRL
jgi:UDP-N-acetyl-D-glucosamine dehydrogenase